MRTVLLIVALVLFLVAGLSAAGWLVSDANWNALVGFGLASYIGSLLVPERFA